MTDQGCMLRGYDRRIVDAINRCHEVTPFIPALAYTFARRPTEIEVKHEERAAGESKYSLLRLIRLNFDLMTGYSRLPLQIFSWSGIVIAGASLLFVLYLAVRRLIVGPEAAGLFTLFGIAFFLLGCVLLGLGIIGEYVGRIFEQVRSRPRYVVAEVIGDDAQTRRPDFCRGCASRLVTTSAVVFGYGDVGVRCTQVLLAAGCRGANSSSRTRTILRRSLVREPRGVCDRRAACPSSRPATRR